MTRHSKTSISVFVVVLLLMLLPLPAAAAGEIMNVSTGASYDSIQDAVDAASSGDVIELAAGTYAQVDPIIIEKALTLRSASGATAVIAASPTQMTAIAVMSPGVSLKGLTVTGAYGKSIGIGFDEPAFLMETSTRTFSLLGCTLEGGGSTDTAVELRGTVKNAEIVLDGNTIRNYEDFGLQSDSADEFIDSTVKVLNNDFENAGDYGIDLDIPATGTDIFVIGNTVTAESVAIYLDDILGGSSLTIKNNNLSGKDEAIYFGDDIVDSTVLIEGNVIVSEEEGIYFSDDIIEGTVTIRGNTITCTEYEGIYFSYDVVDSDLIISENTIVCAEDSGIHFDENVVGSIVTIDGNVITARDGVNFNEYLEESTLTMEGNTITIGYNGLYIYENVISTVNLQHNLFTIKPAAYDGYGVCIDYQEDSLFNFRSNVVTGARKALNLYDEGTDSEITIAGNLFKDNEVGILLEWEDEIALAIAFNAFTGNDDDILFDGPSAPVALLNWWGAAAGPTGLDPEIAFDPWLAALIVAPDQASGVLGEKRTITARLRDSDGDLAETDLLAVRFTVTGAHSLTQVVPMVNGVAALQYAGNPAGVDTIVAEVLFAGEAAGLSGQTQLTWEAKAEPEPEEPGKELPRTSGSPASLSMLGIILLLASAAVLLRLRTAAVK